MTLVVRLFVLFHILLAIPAFGQNAPEVQPQQVDNGYLIIKNLLNGQVMPMAVSPNDCRPDGYRCRNSTECCGFCRSGVCEYGGGNECRPDGAVCRNSLECCGFCRDNVCGNGGGNECRPAGLACRNSLECCNFCRDGVCN